MTANQHSTAAAQIVGRVARQQVVFAAWRAERAVGIGRLAGVDSSGRRRRLLLLDLLLYLQLLMLQTLQLLTVLLLLLNVRERDRLEQLLKMYVQ